MGLSKNQSSSQQALATPPDSPANGWATPQATVKDLKHLFNVLEKVLYDLKAPPSTPVFQENPQPGPDMVQLEQLLKKFNCGRHCPELVAPSLHCPVSNEQDVIDPVADDAEHSPVICTTPNDYKSFEKWASTKPDDPVQRMAVTEASLLEYKQILERWDEKSCKYEIVESETTEGDGDAMGAYVFIIRERVDRKSEQVTRFIDMKSKLLCDILRRVLQDLRAVSVIGDKLSIEENVIFHYLPELNQAVEELKTRSDCDAQCLKHLNLLVGWAMEATASVSRSVSSLLQQGHITYDLLWALFKPGCYVFTTCLGTEKPRCVVFDAGEEITRDGVTYYKLEARYLDHDGEKFGEAGVILGILKFRGSKPIESLDAFPLRYHPKHDQIRQKLVETGRKFRSLVGTHIQRCDGSAFIMKDGEPIKMNINSCVGVDATFFTAMQPNYSRPRVHDKLVPKSDGTSIIDFSSLFDDDRTRSLEKLRGNSTELRHMSEDELLICSPTVRGFSFQEKCFMEFAVSDLRDMQWFPGSFDCLKIPEGSKKLLLSLAKTRLGRTPMVPFDDFVAGKGRGLNILLHGPPGVGKTSTVEAAAEFFNLPLYSISAGELDVDHGDPNALDKQLKRIFKIAKHFDAILLLDEADAFMERRIASLGGHNRLVTVFLRNLEYYDGILFLTTNRATDFDDAVLSRIHQKVKYDNLTKDARREIWSYFLSKANTHQGPATVRDSQLRRLESMALNGRDIKNITSIAHALASDDGQQVDYSYLEMAAEANEKFLEEFGHAGGMYI
ncbi:ATPaseAAA-typecore [Penicillium lividum]|nr:ATPaseAAA-typecore [Penicillium lividum]